MGHFTCSHLNEQLNRGVTMRYRGHSYVIQNFHDTDAAANCAGFGALWATLCILCTIEDIEFDYREMYCSVEIK